MNNRYDEWGNLIERKTFDSHRYFDYDAENRLIKAYGKGPQGQHVTHYYYDGLGRRTSKQVTRQDSFSSRTETTTFLWQGLRLLQEHSPACFYSYLYEPNDDYTPLVRINHNSNSNSIEYYHSEVNGQPLELTDSDGTILWSATYNSWGKLLRLNQINDREGRVFGIDQPLRYAGQYADNEMGLHYNTFRYYDPEVGRFTQQDPIGLLGGTNLYAYVPNPLIYVDPLGLAPCATVNAFDRLNEGKVYRVIRSDENPALGLFGKNPNNIKSVAGHVTSGSRSGSQFISATTDIDVAKRWAQQSGNRIVEINLAKVPSGAIDISSTKGLELLGNDWARRLAKGSSEVLFDSPITPDAIKLITGF